MMFCYRYRLQNKTKSSQISQFLIKMLFFYRDLLRKASDHPPQKISKPRLFFNFFINQTSLVNIYVANAANLQSRAGRDVFGGVQPVIVANKHWMPLAHS